MIARPSVAPDCRAAPACAALSNSELFEMKVPVAPTSSLRSANVIGVLWMLLAVTALTTMFAIAKHVMRSLPMLEVGMFRFVMSLLFCLPWLFSNGLSGLKTSRPIAHLSRGFFGASSLVASIYAMHHMRLADATLLAFTIPLWSMVFAALFLRERIKLQRSIATGLGFVGVLIMLKPQAGFEPVALVALLSAVLATSSITTMKSLTQTDSIERIVFYFLLSGAVMLGLPALFNYQAPTSTEWAWLLLLGFMGSCGQYCMTRAYQAGEMTVIAPFDFTRVIVAGLLGYFVFAEIPDAMSMIGATVIVTSCLVIVRGETVRQPLSSTK